MKSTGSYKDWVLHRGHDGQEGMGGAVDSSNDFGDQLLLPFSPIKHLSTIQEESFSSMECILESLSLDIESAANRSMRSLDASMENDDEVKSSPVRAPVVRVTQNAHHIASHTLFQRDSYKSRVIFGWVVCMVMLDVVLFVLAEAWTPLYILSVLLLGMILGALAVILMWSWEGNACLCGGGGGGEGDGESISHLPHLPNPGRMTPS